MKIVLHIEVDDETVEAFRRRYGVPPRKAVRKFIVDDLNGEIDGLLTDVLLEHLEQT